MSDNLRNPRVLIVTPEITYLPEGMGKIANCLSAKAGGLADVSSALINALFNQGADVHVAIPDYREIFNGRLKSILEKKKILFKAKYPRRESTLLKTGPFSI